jgi:L-iditol 2-dehydrogenase
MSTKILGAYAEYIEIPSHIVERNCYLKPDDLPYVSAAFLEPLSCVVHSLDFLNVEPGSTVAVMGDGGFGLLHAALLVKNGNRAVLVGRHDDRLALARGFGVEHTVNAHVADVAEAIYDLTERRGADALIESTGQQIVWESAPDLVRRGGTVSFFGGLPSNARVSFTAARLHYDEVRLISPFHFTPGAVKRAYELLARGDVDPRPLVTQSVPLSQIAEVFERLDGGQGIKYAVEP